jgi:hypothetical protein
MIGAFLYLTLCTARNRVLARIRRLKNPRYAIGLVVGIAYLYLLVFRRSHRLAGAPDMAARFADLRGPFEVWGGAMLLVVVAFAWLWPATTRAALTFTRADVQFLFTAPISRRQLVGYAILKSQLAALAGSAFFTLIFRHNSLAGGWSFFIGVALLMNVLNLHFTGVSLGRESLARHGRSGWTRQWLPLAVVAAALAVLVVTVARSWPELAGFSSGHELLATIQRIGTHGPLGVVLWPFRALVRLPLAETLSGFARALPTVLLILALNVAWVMSSDARFEEAAAERAERTARARGRRLAPGPRAVGTPFRLSLTGHAETAIVWKNLVLLGRYVSLRTLLRLVPLLIVIVIMVTRLGHRAGIAAMIGPLCMMLALFTVILGPQMMRNDLRQDLARLAVLKTWPVRGATLVRGEVLAPAVVLIAIAWMLVVVAMSVPSRGFLGGAFAAIDARLAYGVAAALVLPGIILMQVLVQNGIAVMFPAWVTIGPGRARGVDVMGQRMFMLAGVMVVLLIAVVPAAIVAGMVAWTERAVTHRLFVVPPAVAAASVLFAQAFLGSEALGRVLDRTDISAIEPEG